MKIRILVVLACLLTLSIMFVACNKSGNTEETSGTEPSVTSESVSDTESGVESDAELEIGDSNQAQGDRESEETSNEYLDYYKQVNDDRIMHVTFGE